MAVFNGGDNNEFIFGSNRPDTIDGGNGNDTIVGNKGDDLKFGGEGNDRLIWNDGDGSDTMRGGSGYDVVEVNGSIDDGDNFELKADGDEAVFKRVNLGPFTLNIDDVERMEINGGGGDDTLTVEDISATDLKKVVFNGGDGNDSLEAVDAGIKVIADGGASHDFLSGSSIGGITDILKGGSGNDTIVGNKGDDLKFGGEGNDRLIWNDGDGSDTMRGGSGYDVVEVNGSIDDGDNFELKADGDEAVFKRVNLGPFTLNIDDVERMEINGGGGDDTLTVEDVSTTNLKKVVFNGGDGNDILEASQAGVKIIASGGAGHDVLVSGDENDRLKGNNGNDLLSGGNGDDTLLGGAGDDTLLGGNGNDVTNGGKGNDTADFSNIAFEITADLNTGSATYVVNGNLVEDKLISIENLNGSNLNDSLTGNAKDNVINGLDGDDTLSGGGGNDTLIGGNGNNIFRGGAGADTFVLGFDGIDVIEDFNAEEGDIVEIALSVFGATSPSQFTYDSSDGSLSYNNVHFTTIEVESAPFDPSQNISFV